MGALLELDGLRVAFGGPGGTELLALDDVGFSLDSGEVLGVVGESGSGKSLTALALMGLLDPAARMRARGMHFAGEDLPSMSAGRRRRLLGADMAMIFQDPIASLNPCFTVGWQLREALRLHGAPGSSKLRAVELLRQVGIADPERRLRAWPHQLSGGMCQRVMIAMAIACNPRLLIADEPTTALDVTIQAQIMQLLASLQRATGMAMLLISHDLALVAQSAQRLLVMYCGQVVESGACVDVLHQPFHPYTAALLAALPERARPHQRLPALAGHVPALSARPTGCPFHPRCPRAQALCSVQAPQLDGREHRVRCFFPLGPP